MAELKYVIGDATTPIGTGKKLICHISNDIGGWGAGFVLALSKRWKEPEMAYRSMKKELRVSGYVQFVEVEDDIMVANMIAQHDVMPKLIDGVLTQPIRYYALNTCLEKVNAFALEHGITLHMPRIGAGLSGGDWEEIEQIIKNTMSVNVVVYDLKPVEGTVYETNTNKI
jgi:O-acetyl-ADP-ribose deacetylase (regulator of RNase III)